MTNCPKCNNNTVIKITTQNKHREGKSTQVSGGIITRIITFPFRLVRRLWRILFVGHRAHFYKESVFKCNYCGNSWPAESEQDN